MELMPLQNDCANSPFDFLSPEIKLSNPNTVSFHTNGSSIAIPMCSFTSFDSLSSENVNSVTGYYGEGISSSDTLPAFEASSPLYTESAIDAEAWIPAQDAPLFPCGFSTDVSDSFPLSDSTNELIHPSQLDFQHDSNYSFESPMLRTRDNSLDSNSLVSDALFHDDDSIPVPDFHLSFTNCVLPVSAPLKRKYTECGDLAKSRLSFLTRNDKQVDSAVSLKPVRHDNRFGDVYPCSSDKDCFFIFSKKHVEHLRSYRSF